MGGKGDAYLSPESETKLVVLFEPVISLLQHCSSSGSATRELPRALTKFERHEKRFHQDVHSTLGTIAGYEGYTCSDKDILVCGRNFKYLTAGLKLGTGRFEDPGVAAICEDYLGICEPVSCTECTRQ